MRPFSVTLAGIRAGARAYLDQPDGSSRLWFNEPADLGGVRYEFLDDVFRPVVDDWLRSPPGTPHPMG